MPMLATKGKLTFLRVHDVGTKFGGGIQEIDVEVVIRLDSKPQTEAFGLTLRNDSNRPAHQGALDLLRDAFNNNWFVSIDYLIPDEQFNQGKRNGVIIRTAITKQ